MAYQALYRTYRPQTFEEVVGQKYIVTTLKNAVTQNKIAHAYLFCGPRGTGKTTVARLLAKAVNCENQEKVLCNDCESCRMISEGRHPDVVEIDGASYGKVETARDLIEKVKYAPLQGKYKVYIIDEVHMLSDSAFNALLKTLEEPPMHAIFVLATTDPQKVLPTIISRCQRFDFTRVEPKDIYERLVLILDNEKMPYEKEALEVISKLADGGLRDALSILDQVIAYSPEGVKVSDVYDVYGITTPTQKFDLINSIIKKDSTSLLGLVNKLFDGGMDIRRLTIDLVEILKECVVYSYTKEEKLLKNITLDNVKEINKQINVDTILEMIDVLLETNGNYRFVSNVNSTFEVACLKMMSLNGKKVTKTIEEKVENEAIKEIKTVKEVVEPTKKEEKIEIKNETKLFDREFLLKLLVSADKKKRKEIEEKWTEVSNYCVDEKYAKVANILTGCKFIAVGKEYALVSVGSVSEAEIINEDRTSKDIEQFTEKLFGEKFRFYAIDSAEHTSLVADFVARQQNNTLPVIGLEQEEIVKKEKIEDPVENTMLDLFGEGSFEVIE